MRRALPVFALVAILAAGCSTPTIEPSQVAMASVSPAAVPVGSPAPSPTAVASPTPSATPAPSPPETPPPGPLPLTAVAERDGVRVQITLDRTPMPAMELTRITTEVRNVGTDVVHWMSDGCEISVGVRAEMPDAPWRPGIEQDGTALHFKAYAIDRSFALGPPRPPALRFVPPADVGKGRSGCSDVGVGHLIPPGKAVRAVLVWDGAASLRWGAPPDGRVRITGTFDGYWRGDEVMPEGPMRELKVSLDSWVVDGADDSLLSPPEVVDAALAHPAFFAYLERLDLGNGSEAVLWYRPSIDLWEVGVLTWYQAPGPKMHLVLVDPHTGAVVETLDRAWDRELDGLP